MHNRRADDPVLEDDEMNSKETCTTCKYGYVDASDFPCSEGHYEKGVLIRYLPKNSNENWVIVKVNVNDPQTEN